MLPLARILFPLARRRLLPCLLFGMAASNSVGAVDLLELYQQALANEPTFRAARAEAEAARESLPQARSQLLPNLQGAGSSSRASTTQVQQGRPEQELDYSTSNYSLTLRQPLYRPQAWAAYKQAEVNMDGYQAKLDGEEQNLGNRVAGAYFDALLAEDSLAFIVAQKEAYLGQLNAAKQAFKFGEGTRTDIDEAQARYDLTLAQELQAKQNKRFTKHQLETLVNIPIASLAKLDPARLDLGPLQPASLEEWMAQTVERNPQMRQLNAMLEAARQEVAKAKAGHLPTVDAFMLYRKTDSDSETTINQKNTTTQLGLQVSVPLFSGGYTQSTVRQALANVDRLQEQGEAVRRALQLQVRKEFQSVVEGQENIRANEVVVHSAEQALVSTRKGVQAGLRTSLDVLNALQQKATSVRNLANARYQYAMARVRLMSLTGSLDLERIKIVNRWLVRES
ncbi:MAG: channel protein TolC [Proteobacteria bacterium]|nr:channel protein TolC [Pseudomonadota bacterium]